MPVTRTNLYYVPTTQAETAITGSLSSGDTISIRKAMKMMRSKSAHAALPILNRLAAKGVVTVS